MDPPQVHRAMVDRPPAAFTPLRSAQEIADRFNVFDHDSLRAFGDAVAGVEPFVVQTGKDHSNGMLQRVLGKMPPRERPLNGPAYEIRLRVPKGAMWWTDIGNPRPRDFDGNCYARYCSEDSTGYVKVFFSPDKTARSLIGHLEELEAWVLEHTGQRLMILRCDFGSEYAVQGRGHDVITEAMRTFAQARPGFRVIPVAPHAQAHNKAERAADRINGLAFLNAVRARAGPLAWSLCMMGAEYQHNQSAPKALGGAEGRRLTRVEALTGLRPDASLMIGHPLQGGWAFLPTKKSNAMRMAAEPVLFICPGASGHLCYNFRRGKVDVVGSVSLITDPGLVLGAHLTSDLYGPDSSLAPPPPGAMEARLRGLLMPDYDALTAAFRVDAWSGLPVRCGSFEPWEDEDGNVVMKPPRALEEAKEPGAALLPWQRGEASRMPMPEWMELPEPEGGPAHTPPVPTPGPAAGGCAAPAPSEPAGPSWALDPGDDRDYLPGETTNAYGARLAKALLAGAPDRSLIYPPGPAKRGICAQRYEAYSKASTVGEYRALQRAWALANAAAARGHHLTGDLTWDIGHGFVRPGPAARAPVEARVAMAGMGAAPEPAPDPATDGWVASLDLPRDLRGVEPELPPHLASADPPDLVGSPLQYSDAFERAYRAVERQLAESVEDAAESIGELGDDPVVRQAAVPHQRGAPIPPEMVRMAMGAPAPAPQAPATVREAMNLPDFHAPNGWRDAMQKEIRRIEGFGAWKVVTATELRESLRLYPDRTSIGHLVPVLTCKADASGDPRAPEVVNKFRVSLSDPANHNAVQIQTHSSCVDPVVDKVVTAVRPALKAEQTTIDVSSAYYHGRPLTAAEGGRNAFAHMPSWLVGLGALGYQMFSPSGERLYLLICGNMPGKRDAGRVWQAVMDDFLRSYGLRQLSVDRRVWVKREPLGDLVVHDHVDDSRLTSSTPEVRTQFHTAWAVRFGETISPQPLNEDFTGVRHRPVGPNATEISCKGVIRRLEKFLDLFPVLAGSHTDSPLPADVLRRLKMGPTATNPLVPERLLQAQRAVGAIGFAAMTGRADSSFAYHVLARQVHEKGLTVYVCRLIGRVIRYLLESVDIALVIRTPEKDGGGLDLFEVDVDSSHGNGPEGLSYGGFALMSRGEGGGAIYWKTVLPPEPADSTGFAELHMCTRALKVAVAVRMLQRDLQLDVAPMRPTLLHTDAQAVLDGTGCERMHLMSRWMSVRLALMRWGMATREIEPAKRASAAMVSDILTKPLVGVAFARARARILGLAPLPGPQVEGHT